MKPNNPFLVYGYHSPTYFCDRETETQKIISALNNVFHNMAEQEKNILLSYGHLLYP